MCLLIILVQLHPILRGRERKRARGQAGARVWAVIPPRPGLPKSRAASLPLDKEVPEARAGTPALDQGF